MYILFVCIYRWIASSRGFKILKSNKRMNERKYENSNENESKGKNENRDEGKNEKNEDKSTNDFIETENNEKNLLKINHEYVGSNLDDDIKNINKRNENNDDTITENSDKKTENSDNKTEYNDSKSGNIDSITEKLLAQELQLTVDMAGELEEAVGEILQGNYLSKDMIAIIIKEIDDWISQKKIQQIFAEKKKKKSVEIFSNNNSLYKFYNQKLARSVAYKNEDFEILKSEQRNVLDRTAVACANLCPYEFIIHST
jgi:hypothetical protein